MRFIRENPSTKLPARDIAPPLSPVPAPRGTIETFASRQSRTMRATSSVLLGNATAQGSPRLNPPSYSYTLRSSARSSTASVPTIFFNFRRNQKKRIKGRIGAILAPKTLPPPLGFGDEEKIGLRPQLRRKTSSRL